MRKTNCFFICLLALLSGCESTPTGPRIVNLEGTNYNEAIMGEFTTWRCRDFVSFSGVLVELGRFTDPDFNNFGFILYDGTDSGASTSYTRQGLNHRWDWGPNGSDYSFLINPDGTGLYYDFTTVELGTSTTANDVYRCSQ